MRARSAAFRSGAGTYRRADALMPSTASARRSLRPRSGRLRPPATAPGRSRKGFAASPGRSARRRGPRSGRESSHRIRCAGHCWARWSWPLSASRKAPTLRRCRLSVRPFTTTDPVPEYRLRTAGVARCRTSRAGQPRLRTCSIRVCSGNISSSHAMTATTLNSSPFARCIVATLTVV
jgi:hypothetical protein